MTSFLDSEDDEMDLCFSPLFEEVLTMYPNDLLEPDDPPSACSIQSFYPISQNQPLFIVLDVYLRYRENSNGNEKIVRVWPGKGHEERFIHLYDSWAETDLIYGDSLFVTSHWEKKKDPFGYYSDSLSTTVSRDNGFLIVNPVNLISGTVMASALKCDRQAYFGDIIQFGAPSSEFLKGNIIHSLIQKVLEKETRLEDIPNLLDNLIFENQDSIFFVGSSVSSFTEECRKYMSPVLAIRQDIQKPFQLTLADRKRPKQIISNLPPFGCKVEEIESSYNCYQYGLKGRIDVLLSHNEEYFPLELKSGQSGGNASNPQPKDDHGFQLLSYIIMMKDRFSNQNSCNSGFLYYVKNNKSFVFNPTRNEFISLISRRNSLASSIVHRKTPKICFSDFNCKYCNAIGACSFF